MSTVASPSSPSPLPTQPSERIRSLDVLRGFALFGVLLMNMQAFADVFAIYMNPHAVGEISDLNFAMWAINRVLADAKFITIFSMLFGAGILLMSERAKARGARAAGLHYRRMGWMALFGFAHAILLWNGDILLAYAVFGMLAWLMRRFWLWAQLLVAALFLAIPLLFFGALDQVPAEDLAEMQEMWAPTAEYIEAKRAAMLGDYAGQIAERFKDWAGMLMFIVVFGWRILACMLLGMVCFRTGIFSAQRGKGFYWALVIVGFGVGLPLSGYGIHDHVATDWDMLRGMGVGSFFNYFGSLFAAFGWVGVVMLLCKSNALPWLRARLAAVGQMAFTNYIMQSVLCTLIFNGHGLGYFGQVERVWQQLLVLGIFALQMSYSTLWLQRFRFGPLEWLWRALAYWQRPAMRRKGEDHLPANAG